MALSRHWTFEQGRLTTFDVAPEPREQQLDETLHLACIAFLTALVLVDEMNGYTEAGKGLPGLHDRLVSLQNERWG